MFDHSSQSKRPKLSLFKETPPDTMVEEQQDAAMVSSTGGDPFRKKAHFLKPILPSSSIHVPPLKLPLSFSSLPSCFDPKGWPLKLHFPGWRLDHYDLQTWVQHLAPVYQSIWKKAGIFEAILSSTYEIKKKKDLVFGLAEKWCCETNTFIFPWGEATITLEDVMVLGGFSVLGDSIFSPLESRELREVEEKLEKERKGLFDYSLGCAYACTRVWMQKFMKSGSELEHEAFLVFWLSRYVFRHQFLVSKAVISTAVRLARGIRIALAPAVLASIYRDMSLLKWTLVSDEFKNCDDALKLTINSPFHLVQVWAWERFLELRPKPNVISCGEPRLVRWDKVDGMNVENWRRVIDSSGEDFMWRPYAMAIDNWNPRYYLEKEMWVCPGFDDELLSFAICLRVTELDGFGTTAQYLPHRVARQFGFDQDIPCLVARSNMHCGKEDPHRAWKRQIREIKNVKLYIPSRLSEADVSTRYLKWWEETVSSIKHISEPSMPQIKKANGTHSLPAKDKHCPLLPGILPKKVVEGLKESNTITDFTISSGSYLKNSEKPPHVSDGSNESNDSFFPPGFAPRGNRIEDGNPMSKHENVETRKHGDSKKLSGGVQNSAPSVSFQGSNNCMQSEKIEKEISLSEGLLGGSKAKPNVETIKGCTTRSQAMNTESITANNCACSSSLLEILLTIKEFQNQFSELKAKVSRLETMVGVSQANTNGSSFRNN
uniref:uncharacterized protein LOC105350524 n=1 Tax=Fragaria vesca subsp. vesca TaxID=101020 RepID=UPI0005C9459D|nr:PREDICTED: uncharacterized protein LOC105350524 [Fragaria vesca subsp. vesca]